RLRVRKRIILPKTESEHTRTIRVNRETPPLPEVDPFRATLGMTGQPTGRASVFAAHQNSAAGDPKHFRTLNVGRTREPNVTLVASVPAIVLLSDNRHPPWTHEERLPRLIAKSRIQQNLALVDFVEHVMATLHQVNVNYLGDNRGNSANAGRLHQNSVWFSRWAGVKVVRRACNGFVIRSMITVTAFAVMFSILADWYPLPGQTIKPMLKTA